MDKALILKEIQKEYDFKSVAEFARAINIPAQNVRNWLKRGTYDEHVLISNLPNLNSEYLLTGEGSIIKNQNLCKKDNLESSILTAGQTIPLLPISAQGGNLNDFVVSVRSSDCEHIISPIAGVDFAISIAGDSMAPEYPSGSQVLVKRINERAFIEWGRVYVLDTCNGSVIKMLMPSDRDEYVMCVSINEKYPPFHVAMADINSIYRVMLCMSIK